MYMGRMALLPVFPSFKLFLNSLEIDHRIREERAIEPVRNQLLQVRKTLAPEEWTDTSIFYHNDVEFEHYKLVATEVKSGLVHYYDSVKGVFQPLP